MDFIGDHSKRIVPLLILVLLAVLSWLFFVRDNSGDSSLRVIPTTIDFSDGVSYSYSSAQFAGDWTRVCTEPFPIYVPSGSRTAYIRLEREKIYLNGQLYGLIIRNENDVRENSDASDSVTFLMFFGRIEPLARIEALETFASIRAVSCFSPTQRDLDSLCSEFSDVEVLDLWLDYFPVSNLSDVYKLNSLRTLALQHPPF